MSWSRPTGSMIAPERICAPTSEPFSTTTTVKSGESCLSRIAAASPAGPAPTITTSNSIASRAGSSSALIGFSNAERRAHSLGARCDCNNGRSLVHPFYCSHTGGIVAASPNLPGARSKMTRHPAARELLAFYQEAGIDALIEETPTDRFAGDGTTTGPPARPEDASASAEERTRPRPFPTREGEVKGRVAPASSPEAAVMAAREAAKSAATLAELRAILECFEGCALRTTATQLVFADGNPKARVMFVGEAPGRDEDIEGLPFVGRSGKLLDRMMAAIGLDRSSAYI